MKKMSYTVVRACQRFPQRRYMEGEKPPETPAPGGAAPPKSFDQKAVDEIVKTRLADAQKKFDQARAADLERMQALETDASKAAELQQQIDELNNRYKSKEELQQEAYKKEKDSWAGKEKNLVAERDTWRTRWEERVRDTDLMSAASAKEADVQSVEQVLWFLQPKSKVVQKVVDNKPVDEWETRIQFPDVKDGKPIVLDLTPAEAIARMKGDVKRFGNLFNSGKAGGMGSNPSQPGSSSGKSLLDMPQEEFNKRYREGTLPKK